MLEELARGGMATVHVGRLAGPAGFSRTVAIKRLHPHLCQDDAFVRMLLDEARLAGRIQHPNVVGMLDVVNDGDEVLLVMEYVAGESLLRLLRAEKARGSTIPLAVTSAVMVDTLRGLHAAHEAKAERGEPLQLIHRDVTPHNVMIRADGTAVVVDFGVAKAAGRLHTTEEGTIKGKLPYMAPEQVRGKELSRRVDIFAAGAVLWEMLVGERAVGGKTEAEVLERLLYAEIPPPSTVAKAAVPSALDAVVMRALSRDPADRFATAAEMAQAIEEACPPATASRVAAWVEELAGPTLKTRAERLAILEATVAIDEAKPVPAATGSWTANADADLTTKAETPIGAAAENSELRAHTTSARRSSSSRFPIVIALVALVALPAAWFGVRALRGNAQTADAGATTTVVVTASGTATPTTSSAIVSITSAEAPASTSASASAVVAPPKPMPMKPKKPRCPPVTIDASGKKRFHPECMNDG